MPWRLQEKEVKEVELCSHVYQVKFNQTKPQAQQSRTFFTGSVESRSIGRIKSSLDIVPEPEM